MILINRYYNFYICIPRVSCIGTTLVWSYLEPELVTAATTGRRTWNSLPDDRMIETVGRKAEIDGQSIIVPVQTRRADRAESIPSLPDRRIVAVHNRREMNIEERKPRDPSSQQKVPLQRALERLVTECLVTE